MLESDIYEIKKALEQHDERLKNLEKMFEAKTKVMNKELSINEFIRRKRPKNNVEKTLVVGYFLETHKGLSSFNRDDLEITFREAKMPVPENINLAIIGNITKGHMMEANEKKNKKKAWSLTNTGIQFIENDRKEDVSGD